MSRPSSSSPAWARAAWCRPPRATCAPRARPVTRPARCSCSTRSRAASAGPGPGSRTRPQGVRPDVLTLAKGLGGGLPIGACIGLGASGAGFAKGDHGSTFGGNPVACAAALAVLEVIERDGLLAHVTEVGRAPGGRDRGGQPPAGRRRARQRAVAGHRADGPGGRRRRGGRPAGRVPGQRGPAGRDPAGSAADPVRRPGQPSSPPRCPAYSTPPRGQADDQALPARRRPRASRAGRGPRPGR